MTRLPSDPTPPDPTAGLTDPRTSHHAPDILGSGPGAPEPIDDAADAPESEPIERDATEDPAEGARGLVDPRSEIPDPSEP